MGTTKAASVGSGPEFTVKKYVMTGQSIPEVGVTSNYNVPISTKALGPMSYENDAGSVPEVVIVASVQE